MNDLEPPPRKESLQRVMGHQTAPTAEMRALHGVDLTRQIERAAQADLPPHTLMQRAGLSVARLALALAPHANTIWIACGPGNNGGDGLEAAMHLKRWGKSPIVTWLGDRAHAPADAALSLQRAVDADVMFANEPPQQHDLAIDALLGIGASTRTSAAPRANDPRMAQWIARMNGADAPTLAVDLPTGLNADTGSIAPLAVRAQFTLSLVSLKPGLFTAHGRDACGEIWLDTLGTQDRQNATDHIVAPTAWLGGDIALPSRPHASHKGSFGDVAIVGGATGMTGAALLAASAALQFGAGRVFVSLLDATPIAVDTRQPELMFRPLTALNLDATDALVLVCGCGGAQAMHHILPEVLTSACPLVLDADALNAIAQDVALQALVRQRATRHWHTVLTPHPLEAARLLGLTSGQVQHDRLAAAKHLADQFGCTVALKGSGTVIVAPGQIPIINPTGNARLSTAGTGDVLAGMIGARLASLIAKRSDHLDHNNANSADFAWIATRQSVYWHGRHADLWPADRPLTASALARSL